MEEGETEEVRVGYWYKFIHHECPVCGRFKTYKQRQQLPKPVSGADRHNYMVDYDWCDI